MVVVMLPDSARVDELSRLVDIYEQALLRVSYVYLNDLALADDAVQEMFIKAYKRLDNFSKQYAKSGIFVFATWGY